ncbi:Formate hydrogenlyase subunit 3 [Cronobacter muytjensii 530]
MRGCVAGLALCCLAGGIAAPWLLPLVGRAVPLALVTPGTTVSQPVMTLLLVGSLLLPFLLMTLFKGRGGAPFFLSLSFFFGGFYL